MQLPTFTNYGDYKSENYGAHTLRFKLGAISVWYSYQTVVAFQVGVAGKLRVLNYTGSRTTFKHLNMIDGGAKGLRLSQEEFQTLWDNEVRPYLKG